LVLTVMTNSNTKPQHVLFVCSGNVCRSAMAEAMMKSRLNECGMEGVAVASCGTEASPLYRVPDIVRTLLAERGIELGDHRSTLMKKKHANKADLILVMASEHCAAIHERFPKAASKAFLLKEYAGRGVAAEIPDPIGQPDEAYRACASEIEACIHKIVEQWRERHELP
jgi:protein arginine phosphatase